MYYDSNLKCKAVFCYLRTQITMDGGSFDTNDKYKNMQYSLLVIQGWKGKGLGYRKLQT